MTPERSAAPRDEAFDDAFAAVENTFAVLFQEMKVFWKDAAASVHPDLQPFAFKVLSTVATAGPVQAGMLADQLVVDKSVVSRQSHILEGFGLLECSPDPSDGRARILSVSELGRERLARVRDGQKAILHERLAGWQPDDLRDFAEHLRRLAGAA